MKKVIVAPLNWGLGHATRCIPIIHALERNNFTPIIASDGDALELLKKEFPKLEYIKLPSYHIRYGKNVKSSLLRQGPKFLKAIKGEKEVIRKYLISNNDISGIISDNRPGVRSKKVPSIYITHQLHVLSGLSTFITSRAHQSMIKKFDECWIPDEKGSPFSGRLSIIDQFSIPVKYIGVLSRFKSEPLPIKSDILIVLSGPEPNRSLLENKLLREFEKYQGKVTLVRGLLQGQKRANDHGKIKMYNYLLATELEKELNQAKLVICRSGYSSIMDLAVVGKKAVFIPTKGQDEQEYLAKHMEKQGIAPFISEKEFELKSLEKSSLYEGFNASSTRFNDDLLHLF